MQLVDCATNSYLLALGDLELLTILDYLDVIALTRIVQCNKRLLLVAEDLMARSPCMVSDLLPLNDVSSIRSILLSKMQSKPTICMIFNTNESNRKTDAIEKAVTGILQSMPYTLALKYIENHSVQHGLQHYPNDETDGCEDKAVIMLGAFPEAQTSCFMLSPRIFSLRLTDGVDAMLGSAGLDKPDADWRVFIISVSPIDTTDMASSFINILQKRYPNASILGGLTSKKMVGVGLKGVFQSSVALKGKDQARISVLAMRGNVPLYTCVSRGVKKVSELYEIAPSDISYYNRKNNTESTDVKTDIALISKFKCSDSGVALSPLQAIEQAAQRVRGIEGLMIGSRVAHPPSPTSSSSSLITATQPSLDDYSDERGYEHGFDLAQFHPNGLIDNGRLVYYMEEGAGEAPNQMQMFQMTPESCKTDIGTTLGLARDRFLRCGHEVMGCLLFTCSGRGPEPNPHFFNEIALDARILLDTFGKNLPVGGYYASGEIGPAVLADQCSAVTVLRRGRATIQGFTAVFGLFALPRRKRESSLSAASTGEEVSLLLASRRALYSS